MNPLLYWQISCFSQSAQKIFGGEVKNHILFFTDNVDKEHEHMKAYKEAAADFKGKVRFLFLCSSEACGILGELMVHIKEKYSES